MSSRAKYKHSYSLTKKHGTSYFIASLLMNKQDRKNVYALYSMCRYADDIVDVEEVHNKSLATSKLSAFKADVFEAIENNIQDDGLLGAISETWNSLDLDIEYLERFFSAMEMDLTTTSYDTFEDLLDYMDGSAAVIGEMMLPILTNNEHDADELMSCARSLGIGFQLTNFIRDIGEDLEKSRIYLPLEDFVSFNVDPKKIEVDDSFIKLMDFNIKRTFSYYEESYPGVIKLRGRNGACVRTAYRLYGEILNKVMQNEYEVLDRRAVVPTSKKLTIAFRELARVNNKSFKVNFLVSNTD